MTISTKDFRPMTIRGHVFKNVWIYDPEDYPQYSHREYIEKVVEFAEVTQQLDQLLEQFQRLDSYGHQKTVVLLSKDFAPYSFAFSVVIPKEGSNEAEFWFNGGLIYHGPHDGHGDGGAPTFSVSLTKTKGWSIHT